MADRDHQSREELAMELASVRLAVTKLERELRLYKRLDFSTEVIEDRLRPLRRRQDELTAALAQHGRRERAGQPRWPSVQRTPSPSN